MRTEPMLHTGVNGIEVSCATTGLWSVAGGMPDHTTGVTPWLSAEDAMHAMNRPAAAAEAYAREILAVNPDDPQALVLLAAAFIRLSRWSEARDILDSLSQSQPQLEFAWRGLGQVLARKGESARALEAFEHALDLEIRGKEAWYALGSLLFSADGERHESPTRSDIFAE